MEKTRLTFKQKVAKEIKAINVILAIDGGGVELVSARNSTVKVRLNAQCYRCPSHPLTFNDCIVKELKEKVPEVQKVEIVK